jgi:hypothetical protein
VVRSPAISTDFAFFSKELYRSAQRPAWTGSTPEFEEARAGTSRTKTIANPAKEMNARTRMVDFIADDGARRMPDSSPQRER